MTDPTKEIQKGFGQALGGCMFLVVLMAVGSMGIVAVGWLFGLGLRLAGT